MRKEKRHYCLKFLFAGNDIYEKDLIVQFTNSFQLYFSLFIFCFICFCSMIVKLIYG